MLTSCMRANSRWLLPLVSLLCTPFAFGQDLLDQVCEQNQAAIDSMRTFSCRIKQVATGPGDHTQLDGAYWRAGDTIRAKYRRHEVAVDSLVKASEMRTITKQPTTQGRPMCSGIVMPFQRGVLPDGDAWDIALIFFPEARKGGGALVSSELLQRERAVCHAAYRQDGGHRYIVVAFSHADPVLPTEREIWYDPALNYLAQRYMVTQTSSESGTVYRAEHTAVRFNEVVPGIFFPERVTLRAFANGKLTFSSITTFTDIRINDVLPRSAFDFRFPAGTPVTNLVQGTKYSIGRDGNPVNVAKDIPIAPPPALAALEAQGETLREPVPWFSWILPVSMALVGVGGLVWMFRKWRASYATGP